MNNLRLLVLAGVLAASATTIASAQPAATPGSATMQRFALDLARKEANGEGFVPSGDPEVSLTATEEGGAVAAILGFKFNNDQSTVTLRVSAPFEKGAEEAELVNLGDLPSGNDVSFRLSHSWSAESWFPSKNLTTACLDINRLLGERFPNPPARVRERLEGIDGKSGRARFRAYKRFWHEFRLHLVETRSDATPPPQWEAILGKAVGKLCAEWNSGRVNDLLLGEVQENDEPSSEAMRENPATNSRSDACNLENLLALGAEKAQAVTEAGLPAPKVVKDEALGAQTEAKEVADAELKVALRAAEDLAVKGASSDAVEALRTSAHVQHELAIARAQRAYDETISAAEKLAARLDVEKLQRAAAKALEKAKKAADDAFEDTQKEVAALRSSGAPEEVVAEALAWAETLHQEALADAQEDYEEAVAEAPSLRTGAGAKAVAKDRKATYEALATAIGKEIDAWSGIDVPFIRTPPETTADFQCNDIDAERLLASLKREQRGAVFRELRAAAPSRFFFTGGYKVASQDFKFIEDSLVLNAAQLVKTKTDREYHQAGRLGASLFQRGNLWSLGWTRKNSWKAKPSAQFCVPRGDGGGLVCATTASGPPGKIAENVLDLQWKRSISPSFALQGEVFYSKDGDSLNPHLLAYFLPQGDKLRGGMDFGYLTKDPDGNDGFQLRLFIGVPFSLGQE